MNENELTQERLKSYLYYCEDSGKFTWIERRKNVRVGAEAGTKNKGGYLQFMLYRKTHLAHRMAWLYVYGELPKGQIDHINQNKEDNRIANLRTVGATENQRNVPMQSNNKSGVCGVRWCRSANKWIAMIGVAGKNKSLGSFDCKSAAVIARKAGEFKYGYCKNHGRVRTSA